MMPDRAPLAGLDAGGTKTELLVQWPGQPAPTAHIGPGVNLMRMGVEGAAERLAALLHGALEGAAPRALVAAVAGAGRATDAAALEAALRTALGTLAPPLLRVVPDALAALEAAFPGDGCGMVILAGTGSVVYARSTDGTLCRAGGWGRLLGDEGSGHALGRAGLHAVAHAMDGGPNTALRGLLAARAGIGTPADLVRRVYTEGLEPATLAPVVLEAAGAGDAVARDLVAAQAEALAAQAALIPPRLAGLPPQAALFGGLIRSDTYRTALEAALRAALPGFRIEAAGRSPAAGALALAAAHADEAEG